MHILQGFTFLIKYNTAITTIAHFPHVELSQLGTKAIASNNIGSIQDTCLHVPHSRQDPLDPFTSFLDILFLPPFNVLIVI